MHLGVAMINRSLVRTGSLLLLTLALEGCAGGDRRGGFATTDDGDRLLVPYDELAAGALSNSELPDDEKADLVYPARFDLVASQSPVADQGGRGVCAMFAATALAEGAYRSAGLLPNADFSEQYLIWLVKAHYQRRRVTSSASGPQDALGAIHEYGVPAESLWPYELAGWGPSNDASCVGKDADGQPVQCYTNGTAPLAARRATAYGLPEARQINSAAQNIKAHLTTTHTGVFVSARYMFQSWNDSASNCTVNADYASRGYVLYPNDTDTTYSLPRGGGHAILIVGWDDTLEVPRVDCRGQILRGGDGTPVMERGFFVFKNSWGTAWAPQNPYGAGYGLISFRYVDELATTWGVPAVTAENTSVAPRTGTTTDLSTAIRLIAEVDPSGATVSIPVSRPGEATTATVSFSIDHASPSDLRLTLISPSAVEIPITNESTESGGMPSTVELTAVRGMEAEGPWRLRVVDVVRNGIEGQINGWTITINRTDGL